MGQEGVAPLDEYVCRTENIQFRKATFMYPNVLTENENARIIDSDISENTMIFITIPLVFLLFYYILHPRP